MVKLFDNNNIIKNCASNICNISDVSINVLQSANSKINFLQMCGNSCTSGTCSRCILKDVNINTVQSNVDVNIFSSCNNRGSGSGEDSENLDGFECFETIDGSITPVECKYTGTIPSESAQSNVGIYIIISIIVIFSILFILYLIYGIINNNVGKKYNTLLEKQKDKIYNIDIK